MRSVLAMSMITFVLIFGGVILLGRVLVARAPAGPAAGGVAIVAAAGTAQVSADLLLERDQVRLEREALLSLRGDLAVEAKELAERQRAVRALLDSLQARGGEARRPPDQALAKLAKMYEAMKPEKAAPLLAALDMDTIVDVMLCMRERPAARILSHMEEALAARISERLSRRGLK